LNLRSNSNENIIPLGLIYVKVKFNQNNYNLKLFIFENGGQLLLGNNWNSLDIKINIYIEMNTFIC